MKQKLISSNYARFVQPVSKIFANTLSRFLIHVDSSYFWLKLCQKSSENSQIDTKLLISKKFILLADFTDKTVQRNAYFTFY